MLHASALILPDVGVLQPLGPGWGQAFEIAGVLVEAHVPLVFHVHGAGDGHLVRIFLLTLSLLFVFLRADEAGEELTDLRVGHVGRLGAYAATSPETLN